MANLMTQPQNSPIASLKVAAPTLAVIDHAVEELRRARDMADQDLQRAISGFREIFTGVPLEVRSGPLLRQSWAVHHALEVVRSLDAALAHLECERAVAPSPRLSLAAA